MSQPTRFPCYSRLALGTPKGWPVGVASPGCEASALQVGLTSGPAAPNRIPVTSEGRDWRGPAGFWLLRLWPRLSSEAEGWLVVLVLGSIRPQESLCPGGVVEESVIKLTAPQPAWQQVLGWGHSTMGA